MRRNLGVRARRVSGSMPATSTARERNLRRLLMATMAALCLAISSLVVSASPADARPNAACTHSWALESASVFSTTTIYYRGGKWQYVGSLLVHVHTIDRVFHDLLLNDFEITRTTANCAS
jgi:hypothetical protein